MKVLHVVGTDIEEISMDDGKYTFIDGDVYVIDNLSEIYIWIGKDSSVDEHGAGAWIANKLDNIDRGGEPSVETFRQGSEPEKFKELVNYEVIDADTPGFLKKAKLDMVTYKLFRIYTKKDTALIDETFVEEVPLDRSSLKSDDTFVLDGNEGVFVWVGSGANREERMDAQKFMQKIDADRQYLPLQYTIYEGEGGKSEAGFYELLKKLKGKAPVVSVEDQREQEYVPEEAVTAEEAKKQQNKEFENANPNDPRARERHLTVDTIPTEETDAGKMQMSHEDIKETHQKLDDTPEPAAKPVVKLAATPVRDFSKLTKKSTSGSIILRYVDQEFTESEKGDSIATCEINIATKIVSLSFSDDASLISRRTASRQAESISKSGFVLSDGKRVGSGFKLEVIEGSPLNESHTRVGHSYNQGH